ncbi:unnamed protein product [Ectocarpus sp. 13 AM-2016]
MFSFLNLQNFNFDFVGDSIPNSGRTGKKKTSSSNGKRESGKQLWLWESHGSSSSSPTANSTANMTPRTEPVVTPPPKRAPLDCPAARAETERAKRRSLSKQSALRNNHNEQRRSSVFFRLPDLDKILKGDHANSSSSAEAAAAAGRKKDGRRASRSANGGKGHHQGVGGGDGDFGHSLAAKLSRPVSGRRRGRRASVAPGGSSPGRTRADRLAAAEEETRNAAAAAAERSTCVLGNEESQEEGSAGTSPAAAAAAGGDGGPPFFESKRGSLLLTVGEEEEVLAPAAAAAAEGDALHQKQQQQQQDDRSRDQKRPSPRSSPRALSAGHRRESCRDCSVISRAPKGLSATRLLEDAQDVARIRSQAGLRAKMEGVCWIASNWCVGGRKGVLSGKRFLVLCDNIVWAELREADRRCSIAAGSVVSGGGQGGTTRKRAAGFMPLIALEGATIQHCEVANSNNGWIIEVVNPSENVTLWLDPENATALLRWGSVLCQALQTERYDGVGDE